jgi:chromosome segregation ATPase
MMTPQQIEQALVALTQQVATLRADNETLLGEYNALNSQYLALSQSVNTLVAERDALKQKVVELEVVNKKLTDMLWGRRSERRLGNSLSPLLDFGD